MGHFEPAQIIGLCLSIGFGLLILFWLTSPIWSLLCGYLALRYTFLSGYRVVRIEEEDGGVMIELEKEDGDIMIKLEIEKEIKKSKTRIREKGCRSLTT